MEKLTDKIAALPPNSSYFSLEFFPPKTQMVGLPRDFDWESQEMRLLTFWLRIGFC